MAAAAVRRRKRGVEGLDQFLELCKTDDSKDGTALEAMYKRLDLDVRKRDPMGRTLFHRVCEAGASRAVVRFLLSKGADPALTTVNGSTPLLLASEFGHLSVVTELLEDGTGLGFEEHMHRGYRGLGSSALLSACRRDHVEVALLLISKGVSVKRDANVGFQGVSGAPSGGGPLHWASLHGRLALVEALVDREADLDERTTDGPPLHWALTRKKYPVAAFLLNRGADPCLHHLNRQGKSLGEIVDKDWLEKLGLGLGVTPPTS